MMSLMVWACLVLSPTMLHSISSMALCCRVAWHCSVTGEWSIVLVLHYSRTVATCLHILQASTALMSAALLTCARALEICVPSCIGRSARLFFMLETHGPQGAVGHVAVPKPTSVVRQGLEP
jgi:hypothetical protein